MYTSEVEICNLALASVGEADITSLTEETKRARLCAKFYAATRNHIMAEFDWPFARRTAVLVEITSPVNAVPAGMAAYAVPSDSISLVDILPLGSKPEWHVVGRELMTTRSDVPPTLRYTVLITATGLFSSAFGNILALGLAARICNPLVRDAKLAKDLYARYLIERKEAWVLEATIGSERNPDDNPELDTFSTGGDDLVYADLTGNQRY